MHVHFDIPPNIATFQFDFAKILIKFFKQILLINIIVIFYVSMCEQ